MARSRDQRSVKNDSAATRAIAHKLGRQVGTWSTVRHHYSKNQPFSVGFFSLVSPCVGAESGAGLLSTPPPKRPFQVRIPPLFSLCSLLPS